VARLSAPLLKVAHRLRRNTKTGSRQNIAAHYDLSNEFFTQMLDRTMMYSCAYFQRPDNTLEEASRAKLDLICRKLHLTEDDHLVEIGSGWGGLACHAAKTYGCRVTTTTISRAQYELAVRRVREDGLSDRVRVLLTDYRDLPALGLRFDKLVSVEMIEAVGHEYYPTFFDVCSRLLKPDGLMLLQAITIDERYYERAKRSVDFIQRFIFPGSCIPSVNTLCRAMAQASDFSLLHLQDIGAHYPPTCGRMSSMWGGSDFVPSSCGCGIFICPTAKADSSNGRFRRPTSCSRNPGGGRIPWQDERRHRQCGGFSARVVDRCPWRGLGLSMDGPPPGRLSGLCECLLLGRSPRDRSNRHRGWIVRNAAGQRPQLRRSPPICREPLRALAVSALVDRTLVPLGDDVERVSSLVGGAQSVGGACRGDLRSVELLRRTTTRSAPAWPQ